jgi:hypothetical protein
MCGTDLDAKIDEHRYGSRNSIVDRVLEHAGVEILHLLAHFGLWRSCSITYVVPKMVSGIANYMLC